MKNDEYDMFLGRDVILDLDLTGIERKIRSSQISLAGQDEPFNNELLDTLVPVFGNLGISSEQGDEVLEHIERLLGLLADADKNLSISYKITVFYDSVCGDCRLEIMSEKSLLPIAIYRRKTERLTFRQGDNAPTIYIISRRHEYILEGFSFCQYEKVFGEMSDELEDAIGLISETMGISPEEVMHRLGEKFGHKIRVNADLRTIDAPVIVKIDGKESVFDAGQKSTNALRAIIKYSDRFRSGANADDVFEEIFETEVMTERDKINAEIMKNDREKKKGDQFYEHGKSDKNKDVLYDRIRHINNKIKKDTGIFEDFIIKKGGKYRINPTLKKRKNK